MATRIGASPSTSSLARLRPLDQTATNPVKTAPTSVRAPVDTFERAPAAAQVQRVAASKPDTAYDGAVVGAPTNPKDPTSGAYPAGTSLSSVPPLMPDANHAQTRPDGSPLEEALFVNGIGGTVASELGSMQAIANQGFQVRGIHNATQGKALDIGQSVLDELDKGNNPAVESMRGTIVQELMQGKNLHIFAHSQGGLVARRAIEEATADLKQRLPAGTDVQKYLHDHLKVESFGSAAHQWPPGPEYVHYVNDRDIVPMGVGLGSLGADGGKDAKLHWIKGGNIFDVGGNHDFDNMYLSHRRPFDEAYAAQNGSHYDSPDNDPYKP